MAQKPVIEVEGGRELRKALKAAGEDLSDFKEAHIQVAEFVIGYADTNGFTPVRTGALRDSQVAAKTGASAGIRFGKGLRYAGFVYNGTRRIKANPWLHRTAEASKDEWLAIYDEAVADILGKAVRGLS